MTNNNLPEQLLELAAKNGAEAAEVYVSNSVTHPVYFEANRLKQLESIDSEGLALRLWKNGQPGLAVAYGAVEAQTLVERAIALSALNEPEDMNLIAAAEGPPRSNYTYGAAISVESLLAWGKDAIAQIQAEYPEVICAAQWDCNRETTRLINSLGLDCRYTDITVDGYVSAEWIRGEDFLNVWYAQSERGDLPPDRIVQEILQHLQWSKNNASAPIGKVPVLFTAKAADILWGMVAAAMSGRQVQQNATPWMDKVGQQVISSEFTVKQEPDVGVYSLPFDDEGTPTQAVSWIDRGVLQGFYGDRRTAKELKIEPTGNGFRNGLGSYPSPSLFNLTISAGDGTLADLIAGMSDGIIIDQVLGDGPGLSGDFSINVDLGYRIENGEIIGRVKDTMVAGNAYTALNRVVRLGSDREWHGSIYLPSVIVDSLSVVSRGD